MPSATLAALLLPAARDRRRPAGDYCFCPEASCPVVYFPADRGESFTVSDLAVPVWQKHPDDMTVPVCYCFGHTPASIADEIRRTGVSTVQATISAQVRAGACACETSNPQGSCCLGNVATTVRAAIETIR